MLCDKGDTELQSRDEDVREAQESYRADAIFELGLKAH